MEAAQESECEVRTALFIVTFGESYTRLAPEWGKNDQSPARAGL